VGQQGDVGAGKGAPGKRDGGVGEGGRRGRAVEACGVNTDGPAEGRTEREWRKRRGKTEYGEFLSVAGRTGSEEK